VLVRERPEQKLGQFACGQQEVGAVEPVARLRERGERQPVPGRDRLVVAERLRPPRAELEQPLPELLVQGAAQDRAAVLEWPQELGRDSLVGRPGEGQALDPVGVGILGGGEAAVGEPQLPQQIVERRLGDLAVPLLGRDEPAVEVRGGEQRIVVEHLLEVRHEPALVDGVTMETAAQQVVHAARGHAVERPGHHRQRLLVAGAVVPAEQELDCGRGRELGRAPEAAPLRVELPPQTALGFAEEGLRQRVGRGSHGRGALQRLHQCSGLPGHVLAPFSIGVGDRDKHVSEARQPVPRLRREVRAAEKRLT